MTRKRRITVEEALAQLQADPEWVRADAERRAQHAERVAQLAREIAPEKTPLLAELASIGHAIQSLDEFINTSEPYPRAIPILARALQRCRHPEMRNMIARSLTTPEAMGEAAQIVLSEFKRGDDTPAVRWVLANALDRIADASMAEELRRLVTAEKDIAVLARLEAALKRATRKSRRPKK